MTKLMYDKEGRQTESEDAALAKQDNNKFYVKFTNVGPDRGHIANPYSMWYNEPLHTGKARHVPKLGVDALSFRPVSAGVYNAYVKFLVTKNQAYYRFAEREIING